MVERSPLRSLILPVYLPTLLQMAGGAALLPTLPIIALGLGFPVPGAAALALVNGVIGVLGPIPVGRLVARVGERAALIGAGVVIVAVQLACLALSLHGVAYGASSAHRYGLVGLLIVSALCQAAWNLGRQTYLGTQLPREWRARGMSTFGGMIRFGQVFGPLAGAAALSVGGPPWVWLVAAAVMAVATLLVTVFLLPGDEGVRADATDSLALPEPPETAEEHGTLRTMLVVGIAASPLNLARVSRPLVLPLLGVALGVHPATISLIFGLAALIEIAMFYPAGTLMDRCGRTAALVPCLWLTGLGFIVMAVLAQTLGETSHLAAVAVVAVSAVLLAIGNSLGAGIIMTLGVDLSPERNRTKHLARWNSIVGIGPLAGPAIVSLVAMVAPVAMAGMVIGVLALAGGAATLKVLPGVTPVPPSGPFQNLGLAARRPEPERMAG